MHQLVLLVTGLLVLATIIPLSRSARWWIRVLDFPRLQLLFSSIMVVALAAVSSEGQPRLLAIALALFCLAYHLYWILPYTALARVDVESAAPEANLPSLRILTANVLMSNRNAAGLIEMVRRETPDLLLTLETDDWWEQELAVLEGDYPYTVKCPLDNLYGIHLYSRLPLHEPKVEYLVEEAVPSIHAELELIDGARVRAHFVHPYPPVPEYSDSSEERDAELIVIAKSLQDCAVPTVVAGDLNDVAWSETTRLFRKISGLKDPRVGRGMFNTFNAKYWFLRWPLDHLFHSDHFRLRDIRRLEKFGSDHFAFYTELVLHHCEPSTDSGLEASEADEEFAASKIEQQEVEAKDVPFDEAES